MDVEGLEPGLAEKCQELRQIISRWGRVAVAFSGGVDSSLLAQVAFEVLDENDLLVFHVHTPLHTRDELENVRTICREIGCRLHLIEADPLDWPEFTANTADRCYHCKKKIFSLVIPVISEYGIRTLLDGTNWDDLHDERPGRRALEELGVITPLADVGLAKPEIRTLAKKKQLSCWDRPSASCLATRIPSGTPITRDLLALVERCESFLHLKGFIGCRVRLYGTAASLELRAEDMERSLAADVREDIAEYYSSLGIEKVLLNLKPRQ